MKLERYTEERERLDKAYERLGKLAKSLKATDLEAALSENRKQLAEDSFKIVVVGEFSRGKSTFLNAMMGKRILPARTAPTTTIINDIVYGEQPRYLLHYRGSESEKEISEEEFREIKAVQEDDCEEYRQETTKLADIAYAKICVPLEICHDGIELIDTPGTNDLDQMCEAITYNFIPQADAAIFLLSAEQPLTQSELDFVREHILKNDISKIFFVINFKDRIDSTADQAKVQEFVRTQLKPVVEEPRVYLVSSKGALNWRREQANETVKGMVPATFEETGFPSFEGELEGFLNKEKVGAKLAKYRQRLLVIGGRLCGDRIVARRNAIGASVQSIEAAIAEMKPRLARARSQSDRAMRRLENSLHLDVEDLADAYERGLQRIARHARQAVFAYDGELRIDEVARYLEAQIAPLQQEHADKMKAAISDCLNREYGEAQRKLQAIYQTEVAGAGKGKALVPVTQVQGGSQELMVLDEVSDGNATLVGGGLLVGGLALAATLPLIIIPAAFFGGNYILQLFRDYRKSDFLDKVAVQVRERYETIIPEQKAGFRRQLQRDFQHLAAEVEKAMDGELQRIEDSLEGLLRDKRSAQQDDRAEKAFLDKTEGEIQVIMEDMKK